MALIHGLTKTSRDAGTTPDTRCRTKWTLATVGEQLKRAGRRDSRRDNGTVVQLARRRAKCTCTGTPANTGPLITVH